MQRRASLIIEVLLSAGFIAVFALVLGGLLMATSKTNAAAQQETQATVYAKDAMEQLVAIKNTTDWNHFITVAGHYRITRGGGTFGLTPIATDEDLGHGFSRRITVDTVFRDGAGNIASVGTADPNSRKITITVLWPAGNLHSVSITQYFINWSS